MGAVSPDNSPPIYSTVAAGSRSHVGVGDRWDGRIYWFGRVWLFGSSRRDRVGSTVDGLCERNGREGEES